MMKRWAWILAVILLLGFVCWGIREYRQQNSVPRTEAEIIQELVQGYVLCRPYFVAAQRLLLYRTSHTAVHQKVPGIAVFAIPGSVFYWTR